MLFSVGSSLPEHRIKAFIDLSDSVNQIQDDEYAQHCGFRAGLVSGTTIFAYMSRPLVELMAKDWLERGSTEVRFLRPIYEGEDIRITGSISSLSKDGTLLLNYQASNSQGTVCASGAAHLPLGKAAHEPSRADYPAGPAILNRPISLESLKVGELLSPITSEFNWNIHWQYCQKAIRDHHPMYEKTLHPGWLVGRASKILAANYSILAWIDVSCQVQYFNIQEEECAIETRGRIQDKFERDGDHFVILDLAVFAPTRCLATMLYTAIFRIAPNAA
jgi:acyl dehydratase